MTPQSIAPLFKFLNIKDLAVFTSIDWASTRIEHRTYIRNGICDALEKQFGLPHDAVLLNLEITPRPKNFSISVSHSPQLGGFAVAPSAIGQLGFDIEVPARVSARIAERVSNTEEIKAAPSPAHLWVAKEATFKSLFGPHQPTTIPEIRLLEWQKVPDDAWYFTAQNQTLIGAAVEGVVLIQNGLILGLAKFLP